MSVPTIAAIAAIAAAATAELTAPHAAVALEAKHAAPAAATAADSDEITSLPGWDGPLPSKHYSGYIDASPTKHLHYYMAESESNPSTDPVLFWFNGGPGCSSLDGFLYEHGPFRVVYNGTGNATLERFEYSWNRLVTTVYVEAPCGVGFSYSSASDTASDYNATDDTAATDNLAAVEAFFEKFPDLKSRDLYITGESYAGIYVPTLAEAIVNKGAAYTGAPLKGIAVGNGCSGNEIGICAFGKNTQGLYYTTKFLMDSGFASEELKGELDDACDWATFKAGEPISDACAAKTDALAALTQDLDTYCVYCDCPAISNPVDDQLVDDDDDAAAAEARGQMRLGGSPRLGTTACINTFEASAYLNRPDVRDALHVNPADVDDWQVCGSADGWQYSSTRPNLPRDTYPNLVKNIDVLIYNGDWDGCVPYTDNEGWTSGMNYTVKSAWHPWEYVDGDFTQVGGYATEYEVGKKFVFTTVRGGRHEVPETAPERAFHMIQRFLNGTTF